MKKIVVVDTNVPVVANGRSTQASPQCVINCVTRLERITSDHEKIALDDAWLILAEYGKNLNKSGQPGVGDAFLKWVLRNRANPDRCETICITPDPQRGFVEFPPDPELNAFDPADRKFVAVALAHPLSPPILQAVDNKWWGFRQALQRNGVEVDFLCEDELANRPLNQRRRRNSGQRLR